MIELLKQVSNIPPIYGSQSFLGHNAFTSLSSFGRHLDRGFCCARRRFTLVPRSANHCWKFIQVRWLGSPGTGHSDRSRRGQLYPSRLGEAMSYFAKASIASVKSLINLSTVGSSSWGGGSGEFSRHSEGKRWGAGTGGRGISIVPFVDQRVASISWITCKRIYMNQNYRSSFTCVMPLI